MLQVTGGPAGSGRKRPLKPKPPRWFCNCETADGMKLNAGYLTRCPDCGEERERRS